MTSEDDSRLESVRKNVIDKHEESLTPKDLGEAILAVGFMLSFFGSAAVLMPSQGSPTGLFSGEFEIQQPDMRTGQLRDVEVYHNGIDFVHDAEVYNPNMFEAELERAIYEIKINGNTISRGVMDGSTVVPADSVRNVATEHTLNFNAVPGGSQVFQKIVSGETPVTVEGALEFDTDAGIVTETFTRSYRLDLD